MSLPEVLIWQRLRRLAGGPKFRRQHPIGSCIVDFHCAEAALVVEIDGAGHDGDEAQRRDRLRDDFISENGYRLLRVRAVEILKSPDDAARSIVTCALSPLHHAAHGPPPRAGEDL